jgi:rhamnulokinase
MNAPVFLAIDLGATAGRVFACRLSEGRLEMEEVHRFPNLPVRVGKSILWDVLSLWREVKSGVSLACRKFGDLRSLAVDTWGIDFALLDQAGELLENPHHYRDPRTEGIMEEVFRLVPKEEIYSRTGIQFMRVNTLYHLYSLARSRRPLLEAAQNLLMIPDLFTHWLSGATLCEFTDATTTQFYNPIKKDWDEELLEMLHIPTHFLTEIVEPGTVVGEIPRDLAAELKSGKLKVVATASHDTASAVAATPLSGGDCAYISSGTWSLVGAEVPEPVINRKSLEYNFTNEGGAFGKFRLLRDVQGMWLLEECRRIWKEEGREYTYEELIKLASEAEPFSAFIDPDAPRLVSPLNMEEEIQRYLDETGQRKPRGVGGMVRVILESLAFKYRYVIEKLQDLLGRKIRRIHIVGGGSKNWLLNQLTADFTGLEVVAGPVEATATGNALVQAAATGMLQTHESLREVVRNSFPLKIYQPSPSREIEDAYNRFLSVTGLE